ncbi:MAG: TonB-dependent siderophore receptor [Pyrinomonadaceae bacterium]
MHCEPWLKAILRSACLSALGLAFCSATLPAEEVRPRSAGAKTEKEAVTLPGMAVTARPELAGGIGYSVRNATTGTKTDTPIFETPFSVQVVPQQVFKDQRSARIKDALKNVSGVRPQPTIGFGTGFIIRGFNDVEQRIHRNGLFATPGTAGFPLEFDTANLEAIEVLKGPASILYGRIEPGGLINLSTKKPLDLPYYSIEQEFGSYEHYRTIWDGTGPLAADNALLYRISGAYQNSDSGISRDRAIHHRPQHYPAPNPSD